VSVAAAALLLCLAQAPGPSQLSLPAFRLNVLASEDLAPDRLRPLAAEGVVLWLSTRSNSLRESTVENLSRFREAWVQLRPPLTAAQAHSLERAPRAGAALLDADLEGKGLYLLGTRPVAVRVVGSLDEARAQRIRDAHPAAVIWEPGDGAELLGFGLFRQLPGRKLVRLGMSPVPAEPSPEACPSVRGANTSAVWVDAQKNLAAAPPCGLGVRARISPRISDEALRRLVRLDPAVEFEIDVGADDQIAAATRDFLRRISLPAAVAP
jgi:hypothetical protein